MELSFLIEKNPWWKGKEHFGEDEDYRRWSENSMNWTPEIVNTLPLKPFSLHILLGPRQAGKTTVVKLIIKRLLEDTDPKSVFYFRCDVIKDHVELLDILNSYLKYRDDLGIKKSYIFLDEITMPKEWFRAIKELIDSGKFKNDVVILTGSTSIKIKKSAELFPGRRGYGRDFSILPLSFRNLIKILKPDLYRKLPRLEIDKIGDRALHALPYLDELRKMFELYLRIGGFPLALVSWKKNNSIDDSIKQVYLTWIKNDIYKAGKEESIAKEILKSVLSKIPSRISWEGISKEISVKSPKTVNSYLHLFSEMFLLHISYFLDPNSSFVEFGKNKKIAFIDPLIYSILEEWCLTRPVDPEPAIVEGIVTSHLSRFFNNHEVYYWSNGTEVDVVVRNKERILGFEVKWQKKPDAKKIVIGKMKDVYVLSKDTFDKERKIIPISLFLAMLEENEVL